MLYPGHQGNQVPLPCQGSNQFNQVNQGRLPRQGNNQVRFPSCSQLLSSMCNYPFYRNLNSFSLQRNWFPSSGLKGKPVQSRCYPRSCKLRNFFHPQCHYQHDGKAMKEEVSQKTCQYKRTSTSFRVKSGMKVRCCSSHFISHYCSMSNAKLKM